MIETTQAENKVTGKITKISDEGWGFISSREIEFTRIFFHWSALEQNTKNFKELKVGMKVEFIPIEVPEKGFRAIRVRVIDDNKEG